MARTLRLYEGMFEWNVERFLQYVRPRTSRVFMFGLHESYLKLNYNFSEVLLSCDIRQLANFEITLHIADLSEKYNFSKWIYFKGGFISRNGDVYFYSKIKCLKVTGHSLLVMSCYKVSKFAPFENLPELVPENTLTFRLAWSDNEDILDSKIQRGPPTDQIKEQVPGMSLETLSENFESFFKSRTNTDCVLVVGDEQFQVHRAVLSDRSEVFEAMFQHDTLEKRNGVVNIPDVDAAVMSEVLYYVYTGDIRRLDAETAAPLYVASDKYALLEMKVKCLDFLMDNLTVETFVEAIDLGYARNESALEKKVTKFIAEDPTKVLKSNAWKEFSRTNLPLAFKCLESVVIDVYNTLNETDDEIME